MINALANLYQADGQWGDRLIRPMRWCNGQFDSLRNLRPPNVLCLVISKVAFVILLCAAIPCYLLGSTGMMVKQSVRWLFPRGPVAPPVPAAAPAAGVPILALEPPGAIPPPLPPRHFDFTRLPLAIMLKVRHAARLAKEVSIPPRNSFEGHILSSFFTHTTSTFLDPASLFALYFVSKQALQGVSETILLNTRREASQFDDFLTGDLRHFLETNRELMVEATLNKYSKEIFSIINELSALRTLWSVPTDLYAERTVPGYWMRHWPHTSKPLVIKGYVMPNPSNFASLPSLVLKADQVIESLSLIDMTAPVMQGYDRASNRRFIAIRFDRVGEQERKRKYEDEDKALTERKPYFAVFAQTKKNPTELQIACDGSPWRRGRVLNFDDGLYILSIIAGQPHGNRHTLEYRTRRSEPSEDWRDGFKSSRMFYQLV